MMTSLEDVVTKYLRNTVETDMAYLHAHGMPVIADDGTVLFRARPLMQVLKDEERWEVTEQQLYFVLSRIGCSKKRVSMNSKNDTRVWCYKM
jgi:hypothetical protein